MPEPTADNDTASTSIDHEALLTLLNALYRSTERINDCFGVAVATHDDRLPKDVINPDTFARDIAEIGYGEATHHLELLARLCELLHIGHFALAEAPQGRHERIRLNYH